jgi:hypothetical protein
MEAVAEAVRGELGEVIAGLTLGRITDDEIVVFDSPPCRMWPWPRRFMSAQWRGTSGGDHPSSGRREDVKTPAMRAGLRRLLVAP